MKNLELEGFGLVEMERVDMQNVGGGGLLESLIENLIYDSLPYIYYMGQVGGKYQQSLPSNLKK